jgi:hypothetical protein
MYFIWHFEKNQRVDKLKGPCIARTDASFIQNETNESVLPRKWLYKINEMDLNIL